MQRRVLLRPLLMGLLLAGMVPSSLHAAAPGFERMFMLVGDYPLGISTNRMDYESYDPTTGRLFIAKMGEGHLLVFDTKLNQLIKDVPGFPKITGVLAVPQMHRLYASVPGAGLGPSISVALGMAGLSSGTGALAVLDSDDLHEIARLPAGVFPDGITHDPVRNRVFVSDEFGGAVMAFDAATNKPLARIDTGGQVGNVRYDKITDRIYVPVQNKGKLAAIDPQALTVLESHPLPGGSHPHGLIIAPGAAIGYVACDGDDRLLVVDLAAGKVLSVAPLGHDPDVLAIDEGRKRLYVASESGMLSIFDITKPTAPVSLGDVFIGANAHTIAVDPATHRLFFAMGESGGQAMVRVLLPKP